MQLQLQPGLERIQTGWWDQNQVQRDYYIGRNNQGQWCWAFKNTSGWYLQGYFA
jgi:protein ImuB